MKVTHFNIENTLENCRLVTHIEQCVYNKDEITFYYWMGGTIFGLSSSTVAIWKIKPKQNDKDSTGASNSDIKL